MEKKPTKDEIFWKVLDAAIALDVKKGHLKWRISDLARKAKVSRPLIYYYFGKNRLEILHEGIHLFGDELAGLSEKRIQYWEKGDILESVLASRKLCHNLPHFVEFYFTNRNSKQELGFMLQEIEKRYLKKLRKFIPNLTKEKAVSIFGLLLGLTFAPDLTENAVKEGVSIVLSGLKAPDK